MGSSWRDSVFHSLLTFVPNPKDSFGNDSVVLGGDPRIIEFLRPEVSDRRELLVADLEASRGKAFS